MKKLMILGAIAAATVGYGAEASYLAQVYDVALTMKTGVCKAGKATAATVKYYDAMYGANNGLVERGDEMGFRNQATRKIAGVIWGCNCETIAAPRFRRLRPIAGNGRNLGGYVFWDQTADTFFVPWPFTRFGWFNLNRIGKDFKTVEGTWALGNVVDPQALFLVGAGFGKASVAANTCRSIISKISGSFAGFRMPGTDDAVGNCPYCGIDNCTIDPFCFLCATATGAGWINRIFLTSAYGSWSIKFNKTASNKLKNTMRITSSYKFKKAGNLVAVLTRMEDFVERLDRAGVASSEDIESTAIDMEEEDGVKMLAYAYDPSLKVSADGELVDASGEAVDLDSLDADEFLKAIGYNGLIEEDDDEDDAGALNPVTTLLAFCDIS